MDGPDAVEGDHGEVIQSVHRPKVSVCSSGEYGDWLFIQLDDMFNIAGIKTNTYQLDSDRLFLAMFLPHCGRST